jgi:hypothetical protein
MNILNSSKYLIITSLMITTIPTLVLLFILKLAKVFVPLK